MDITKSLHKIADFLNLTEETALESFTQFLKSITLLEKEKENKQPLEIQFKTHKQRYLIKLYAVNPGEDSSESLDTAENSGRNLLDIEKLNYNEDLSKLYQLGYWVQNNLIEPPTHFITTEDLYNY